MGRLYPGWALLGLAGLYSRLLVGWRSVPVVSYWLFRASCVNLDGMAEVQEAKQNSVKYVKPLLTQILCTLPKAGHTPEPKVIMP